MSTRRVRLSSANTVTRRQTGYVLAPFYFVLLIVINIKNGNFETDGLLFPTVLSILPCIVLLYKANKLVEAEMDDTTLYLKKGRRERTIPLHEVADVESQRWSRFGKKEKNIVVELQPHHAMGKSVVIIPVSLDKPDEKRSTIEALIKRIEAAEKTAGAGVAV